MFKFNHNISLENLYSLEGLQAIDALFLSKLAQIALKKELLNAREAACSENITPFTELEKSGLILKIAPHLEDFIAELFGISNVIQKINSEEIEKQIIFQCKKFFIQKHVYHKYSKLNLDDEIFSDKNIKDITATLKETGINLEDDLSFATYIAKWDKSGDANALRAAEAYAAWALFHKKGQTQTKSSVLFKSHEKINHNNLIADIKTDEDTKLFLENDLCTVNINHSRTPNKSLSESHYCLYCHNREKDSCSKGFKANNNEIEESNNIYKEHNLWKNSSLGVPMTGCPLNEKISEMNLLRAQGNFIGALAVAIIDNPMLAATGHRICNECMRSCIYQKHKPVDIPFIETDILDNVLNFKFGFEIYSLLTRWNPLNFSNYLPKQNNGYKVLIVGLGPAGFTLAHYLLNEGYAVVGIDGLKIEPLDHKISGIALDGTRCNFTPIEDINNIFIPLSERKPQGFGGVMEYGITSRWNKNYLTIIRLLLERRQNFRMYGSTRFGSNIDYHSAKKLGFDHIALAMGAGKPNIPDIPDILATGARTASDFLMTLQLTGAGIISSLANLQIRMPILVIGGGLTAIDSATESLHYYPIQVEKLLRYYEECGDSIFEGMKEVELEIANEFLLHARELREYKGNKIDLLRKWGGANVVYRKNLEQSPSYTLNHEEVEYALKHGIYFTPNIIPVAIEIDESGYSKGVLHKEGFIEAKTILIATGTSPNVAISKETNLFELDGQYFHLTEFPEYNNVKGIYPNIENRIFSKVKVENNNNEYVSIFGDLHPKYSGNVVKAMASAKNGYKILDSQIRKNLPLSKQSYNMLFEELDNKLIAKVVKIEKLTNNILELKISSSLAASKFKPGQFFKLQNYLVSNKKSSDMEPLALTGASVNNDVISLIILESGASSQLCENLKIGDIVSLMGPTGTATEIPYKEKVMLVGGGLGNAVLFSIGKAMRQSECQVLYFAGYRKKSDRYKVEEIEAASDIAVWCCENDLFSKNREQDQTFQCNIIDGIKIYGESMGMTSEYIPLNEIDRIIVIGSESLMSAFSTARHSELAHLFKKEHIAIGSINSPMQCMMKEICGQCLQKHNISGKDIYVYSCCAQDQLLDTVDFNHLKSRLKQNSVQEKASASFLAKSLKQKQ